MSVPDEGYYVPDEGYYVPDEGYSRNASYALNWISTFLVIYNMATPTCYLTVISIDAVILWNYFNLYKD